MQSLRRRPRQRRAAETTAYPVTIAGTGAHLPGAPVTSAVLDERLGVSAGSVFAASGVASRYFATSESLIDMGASAARAALHDAGRTIEDIDCILFARASGHQAIPTSAILLKVALGARDLALPAFDIDATCLGFFAAVDVASAFIASGRYDRILVVAADKPSIALDWTTLSTAAIFGDGAGAMVLEYSSDPSVSIAAIAMETWTEGAPACEIRSGGVGIHPRDQIDEHVRGSYFQMDGTLAYRVSAEHLPDLMARTLAAADTKLADITVAIPHQASATALALMERRLRFVPGQMLNIFSDHGNQVSASIPIAIDTARKRGLAVRGSTILVLGTAAGISLGAAVWKL